MNGVLTMQIRRYMLILGLGLSTASFLVAGESKLFKRHRYQNPLVGIENMISPPEVFSESESRPASVISKETLSSLTSSDVDSIYGFDVEEAFTSADFRGQPSLLAASSLHESETVWRFYQTSAAVPASSIEIGVQYVGGSKQASFYVKESYPSGATTGKMETRGVTVSEASYEVETNDKEEVVKISCRVAKTGEEESSVVLVMVKNGTKWDATYTGGPFSTATTSMSSISQENTHF